MSGCEESGHLPRRMGVKDPLRIGTGRRNLQDKRGFCLSGDDEEIPDEDDVPEILMTSFCIFSKWQLFGSVT